MGKKHESVESQEQTSLSALETSVPGVEIEQVAIVVPDIDVAVGLYDRLFGTTKWVRDDVEAANVGGSLGGSKFSARLAFNYELVPGKEFELIQIVSGRSIQQNLRPAYAPGLSHLGLHVEDIDAWLAERPEFASVGMHQMVMTRNHSGTSRRYRYALLKTERTHGFVLKLIQRVSQ